MKRVAIVTGGTRGLGKAISIALHEQGYRVAAVYHSNADSAQAFREATAIDIYQWDVSDPEACQAGIAQVQGELGQVDILVNNAGVTSDAVLHKMTVQQWSNVIQTNLGSMFNMCHGVISGMRERAFGRIVNISSVNAQKGQFGQANYAAAKAGILGFTKSLALESAHKNITVNAVAPGYCDTDMVAKVPKETLQTIIAGIPVGRLGKPEDIARMVAFLVHEDAGFITGATFSINGGQHME
jgi:acetoacetyl-CoA reductase